MLILLWVIISNKLMAISPVKIQFAVFQWTKFSYKGIFLQNKRSDIWVHWSTGMLYKLYIQNACHVWKDSRHIVVVAFLLLVMLSPMVDTACISTSTKTHDQANPFTPNSGQNENLRKIPNLILQNTSNRIVPIKSTAKEVSFEWSHHRISSTDSKVRTTNLNN